MANELGKVEILKGKGGWMHGDGAISVRCSLGRIIAYPGEIGDEYNEICVDLFTDDGRVLQLACIGMDEEDPENIGTSWDPRNETPDYQPLHVYAWDGVKEMVQHEQYVKVGEDSYWYPSGDVE